MDFENYKDAFIAKAKEKCKSQEYIDRCLAYAKKICDNGCPVIYKGDKTKRIKVE